MPRLPYENPAKTHLPLTSFPAKPGEDEKTAQIMVHSHAKETRSP